MPAAADRILIGARLTCMGALGCVEHEWFARHSSRQRERAVTFFAMESSDMQDRHKCHVFV